MIKGQEVLDDQRIYRCNKKEKQMVD